jgi:nucleoside-diphosphate-sugar epimerase
MKIVVIGAGGFVGSAIVNYLKSINIAVESVHRTNFKQSDNLYDICIDASGSSKKFIAEENPAVDLVNSVVNCSKVLKYYPSKLHILISSVDIYKKLDDPITTNEDNLENIPAVTRYGYHKFITEQYVKTYSTNWLIFRLSGMIGDGLKKNPIFDLITGNTFWISPKSEFQYINTESVSKIIWEVINKGICNEIFNIAGKGTISFEQLAIDYGLTIKESTGNIQSSSPRILEVSTEKISRIIQMPYTIEELDKFIRNNFKLWG